jgi:hypothetical protein
MRLFEHETAGGHPHSHPNASEGANPRADRFPLEHRDRVSALMRASPRLADLAASFPALLVAIARSQPCDAQDPARTPIARLAIDGAPLSTLAAALGIAMWLRRLPPEAFVGHIAGLPGDADFAREVVNFLPRDSNASAAWLQRVAIADRCGGRTFALWCARHHTRLCALERDASAETTTRWLASWTSHGGTAKLPATPFLRVPWATSMGPKRALDEMQAWRDRVTLHTVLQTHKTRIWHADGVVEGFSFSALRTAADFIAASQALDNCLDQYGDRLLERGTSLHVIKVRQRIVACVELGQHPSDIRIAHVVRLLGRANKPTDPRIWQATYRWLASPGAPFQNTPRPGRSGATLLADVWGPYVASLRHASDGAAFMTLAGLRTTRRVPSAKRRRGPQGTAAPV